MISNFGMFSFLKNFSLVKNVATKVATSVEEMTQKQNGLSAVRGERREKLIK